MGFEKEFFRISGWLDFEARQVVRATRIWAQGDLVGNNWWPETKMNQLLQPALGHDSFCSLTETSAWKRNKGVVKFPSIENQRWWGVVWFWVRQCSSAKGLWYEFQLPGPRFAAFNSQILRFWCVCPGDVLGYHRNDFKKDETYRSSLRFISLFPKHQPGPTWWSNFSQKIMETRKILEETQCYTPLQVIFWGIANLLYKPVVYSSRWIIHENPLRLSPCQGLQLLGEDMLKWCDFFVGWPNIEMQKLSGHMDVRPFKFG